MSFQVIFNSSLDPQNPQNILFAQQLFEAIAELPNGLVVLEDAIKEGNITIRFVTNSTSPNHWNPKKREIQIDVTGSEYYTSEDHKVLIRGFVLHQVLTELCKAANPLLSRKTLPPMLSHINADAYALEMAQREFVSFKLHTGILAELLNTSGIPSAGLGMDFNTYWNQIANATNGSAAMHRKAYTEAVMGYEQKLNTYYQIITNTQFNFTDVLPLDSQEVMALKITNNMHQARLATLVTEACGKAIDLLIRLKVKACPEIQAAFKVNENLELLQTVKKLALETYRMVYLGARTESAQLQVPAAVQLQIPAAATQQLPVQEQLPVLELPVQVPNDELSIEQLLRTDPNRFFSNAIANLNEVDDIFKGLEM